MSTPLRVTDEQYIDLYEEFDQEMDEETHKVEQRRKSSRCLQWQKNLLWDSRSPPCVPSVAVYFAYRTLEYCKCRIMNNRAYVGVMSIQNCNYLYM